MAFGEGKKRNRGGMEEKGGESSKGSDPLREHPAVLSHVRTVAEPLKFSILLTYLRLKSG